MKLSRMISRLEFGANHDRDDDKDEMETRRLLLLRPFPHSGKEGITNSNGRSQAIPLNLNKTIRRIF